MKNYALLATLLLSCSVSVQAKVALVIGNGQYTSETFDELPKAVSDAHTVAQKLHDLGYQVIEKNNLTLEGMQEAVREFHDQLKKDKGDDQVNDKDKGKIGVFYYAGHGMQVDGSNYLIPSAADIQRNYEAKTKALLADEVLNAMSEASSEFNIIVLDACRDNLLTTKGGSKRGLANMTQEKTFVAFATQKDESAYDGVFVKHLQNWLDKPNVTIDEMVRKVRDAVRSEQGDQIPSYNNNLKADFYFNYQPNFVSAPPQTTVVTPPVMATTVDRTIQTPSIPSRLAFEPDMVAITGGCFSMGSPTTEKDRDSDEKQHEVCVKDFALGKTEVTRGQFKAFVTDTGYKTEAESGDGCYGWTGTEWKKDKKYNWRGMGFEQTDDHPVACVSWNDAQAYSAWLNKKTGKNYSLPTEAQWEYAARAGSKTARYWGDDADAACRYANGADQTAKQAFNWSGVVNCSDGYAYTAPVASFTANAYGLYDMLGNVWEWTCSEYERDYAGKESQCTSNKDAKTLRVLRGGSWDFSSSGLRSADRYRGAPGDRYDFIGLRLSGM